MEPPREPCSHHFSSPSTLCTSQKYQKYSDDSAIEGCVSKDDDMEYHSTTRSFASWRENNHLCLSTRPNTNELVVDPEDEEW